jgi:hypothetical protein
MDTPYYEVSDDDGTYRRWTLVQDIDGEYIRHERAVAGALLSGDAYVRNVLGYSPVEEFLASEQPSLAKTRLQRLLDGRNASRS